jgi:hypothetical protein
VYEPAAVSVFPYHKYGNLFAQIDTEELVIGNGVTVKVRLTIVSQLPVGPGIVSLYEPDAVSVLPYHKYGNLFAQIDTEELVVGSGSTVTLVVHSAVFPQTSVTIHLITDVPTLKDPPALAPLPLRIVEPVI